MFAVVAVTHLVAILHFTITRYEPRTNLEPFWRKSTASIPLPIRIGHMKCLMCMCPNSSATTCCCLCTMQTRITCLRKIQASMYVSLTVSIIVLCCECVGSRSLSVPPSLLSSLPLSLFNSLADRYLNILAIDWLNQIRTVFCVSHFPPLPAGEGIQRSYRDCYVAGQGLRAAPRAAVHSWAVICGYPTHFLQQWSIQPG